MLWACGVRWDGVMDIIRRQVVGFAREVIGK